MKVKSIFQLRLYRGVRMFFLAFAIFAIGDYGREMHFGLLWVLVAAIFFTLFMVYVQEYAEDQFEIHIRKGSLDDLVADLEFLGFTRIDSNGSKIYLLEGENLVKLSPVTTYVKVALPHRYEFVGEQYRSI